MNPLDMLRDPLKDEEVVVALMEKMLEMEATIPELDAISKKASGEESPNPNLPLEAEEKTANRDGVAVLSQNSTSLEKEAPDRNSQKPVMV